MTALMRELMQSIYAENNSLYIQKYPWKLMQNNLKTWNSTD